MGKPYVPYTAKRIITACLEHNWDFELVHGPVTLFLRVTDGNHRASCEFRKTPGVDTMGRPTNKYETVNIAMENDGGTHRAFGMSIDSICMFIETHTMEHQPKT